MTSLLLRSKTCKNKQRVNCITCSTVKKEKLKPVQNLRSFFLKWQRTAAVDVPVFRGQGTGDICSKLDTIQATTTLTEIEKFTGDWLQKWEVKDMEIILDRHDPMLAKNESTKSHKNGK